jgi:dihydroneopterin aldolase
MPHDRIIVLKIGGSLAEGASLPGWLAALPAGRGRAVIVPGGGVFADAVRHEQQHLGFSDRTANRMALLAMEQYALVLADLVPALTPCRTIDEMRWTLAEGGVPVWLPSLLALADRSIPESWEVTSDSLAAWLAATLGARSLVLVKSVAAPRPLEPAHLAAQGMVDTAFPRFFRGGDLALDWLGPGEEERLADLLAA